MKAALVLFALLIGCSDVADAPSFVSREALWKRVEAGTPTDLHAVMAHWARDEIDHADRDLVLRAVAASPDHPADAALLRALVSLLGDGDATVRSASVRALNQHSLTIMPFVRDHRLARIAVETDAAVVRALLAGLQGLPRSQYVRVSRAVVQARSRHEELRARCDALLARFGAPRGHEVELVVEGALKDNGLLGGVRIPAEGGVIRVHWPDDVPIGAVLSVEHHAPEGTGAWDVALDGRPVLRLLVQPIPRPTETVITAGGGPVRELAFTSSDGRPMIITGIRLSW